MKFLKQLFSVIRTALGIGLGFVRNHNFHAVEITEQLKKAVRSKAAYRSVELIPGQWDNRLRTYADEKLFPVLSEVAKMVQIIRDNEKDSIAIDEIIKRLGELNPSEEAKVYQEYAARWNHRFADGRLTFAEAWDAAQDTFFTFFKKKK